jgi:hypothetical protein
MRSSHSFLTEIAGGKAEEFSEHRPFSLRQPQLVNLINRLTTKLNLKRGKKHVTNETRLVS